MKVVQIGCGKMAVYTMRYVLEKGGKLVGAFDINPKIIGKDVAELLNLKKSVCKIDNVKDLDARLKKLKPDIAIITTMSLMKDCHDALMICAQNGVNAITTCEEAFFPWNSYEKTAELDKIAKANNCTLCGSGYQDVSWGSLITALCGTTQHITKIKGSSSYNVEDYGIALAQVHGAGLTKEEFEKNIVTANTVTDKQAKKLMKKDEFLPSYMWNVNGWLASALGLNITEQSQACEMKTYPKNLNSSTLNMTIKKGDATGMSAIVTTKTKEGITIESECIGKVYAPEEFDKNTWTVYGEPNTTITIDRPQTVELTCASIVNRLPDVIKAPAGYTTTEKMGELRFKKSL